MTTIEIYDHYLNHDHYSNFDHYFLKQPKYLSDTYLPIDPQEGAIEKLRKQNFVQSNPIYLCHKVYVSQYSKEEKTKNTNAK